MFGYTVFYKVKIITEYDNSIKRIITINSSLATITDKDYNVLPP